MKRSPTILLTFALAAAPCWLACGAKPRSADDDAAPSASASASGASEAAPALACGELIFLAGTGHDAPQRIVAMDAQGGAMRTLHEPPEDDDHEADPAEHEAGGHGHGGGDFPALLEPSGEGLMILRSQPAGTGKTHDELLRLALGAEGATPVSLTAGFGPAMIRNPSRDPAGRFLVFESDANSFRDLYRLELSSNGGDAPAVLRLTGDEQGNFEPALSPDGERVAFVSSRDGNAELYTMTADGGAPTRLTTSPGDDSAPRWSADGQTLAFVSARDLDRGMDVFVIPAAGGEAKALLPARDAPVLVRDLSVSPDGTKLAFTELSQGAGATVVVVSFPEGSVLARSRERGEGTGATPLIDEQPVWSPDGKHLAFTRGSGPDRSDILRMDADGRERVNLTMGPSDNRGVHWLPRWSPSSATSPTSSCARR